MDVFGGKRAVLFYLPIPINNLFSWLVFLFDFSFYCRLDKRTSLLDVRLEWQEVERISLINQLGKFHGRSQADGAESSSASQNAPRKIFPQRYVTAFSKPGNVPEGVLCLTL